MKGNKVAAVATGGGYRGDRARKPSKGKFVRPAYVSEGERELCLTEGEGQAARGGEGRGKEGMVESQ